MAPSQLPATPSNSPTAIPATITVVSYRYDTEGNLSEVIDRQGQLQRSFTYQNHLMVTQRFASGLLCY